jgi:hypothetical protein
LISNVEAKQLGVRHFSLLRSCFHDAGVAGGEENALRGKDWTWQLPAQKRGSVPNKSLFWYRY